MKGQSVSRRSDRWIVVAAMVMGTFSGDTSDAGSAIEKPLATIKWKDRHERGELTSGKFVLGEGKTPDRLQLVHDGPGPVLLPLCEFSPPRLTERTYALRAQVKHQGVQGVGYLEMWSHFADGSQYFTRTLATAGPMGQITGFSDGRMISLPFDKADAPSPTKLVVNLYLPGRGIVELTDLELYSPADEFPPTSIAGAWWSDRMGGLVGGLGGSFLGVFLGGCLGPLIGMGKARRFVMASFVVVGVLCAGMLVAGVIAVVSGQPYGVYYPLILLGGLGCFFCVMGLLTAGPKYDAVELRRMTALDAAR